MAGSALPVKLQKSVKRRRVVDEDAGDGRFVTRPVTKNVEKGRIVGHRSVLDRGMGPVAAPEHALRRGGDKGPAPLAEIVIAGPAGAGDVVRGRELDPALPMP